MKSFVNKYVLDRDEREAVEDYMGYLDGLGYWPGAIHHNNRGKAQAYHGTDMLETVTIHLVP